MDNDEKRDWAIIKVTERISEGQEIGKRGPSPTELVKIVLDVMNMRDPQEPLIHSFITDSLPKGHRMAHQAVYCLECKKMVHASNNECMDNWVETGKGPYCLNDFATLFENTSSFDDDIEKWGL